MATEAPSALDNLLDWLKKHYFGKLTAGISSAWDWLLSLFSTGKDIGLIKDEDGKIAKQLTDAKNQTNGALNEVRQTVDKDGAKASAVIDQRLDKDKVFTAKLAAFKFDETEAQEVRTIIMDHINGKAATDSQDAIPSFFEDNLKLEQGLPNASFKKGIEIRDALYDHFVEKMYKKFPDLPDNDKTCEDICNKLASFYSGIKPGVSLKDLQRSALSATPSIPNTGAAGAFVSIQNKMSADGFKTGDLQENDIIFKLDNDLFGEAVAETQPAQLPPPPPPPKNQSKNKEKPVKQQ